MKNQTETIDEILIINNSSTDGTDKWLKTQKNITVLHQENLGGAGGFNRGVEYCYKNNADWIWMMDDDVYPEKNALETMISYKSISECIIPNRFYSDNTQVIWGGIYDFEKRRLVKSTRPSKHD